MSQLSHHDRYDYNPIIGREDFDWPNGKRLAIYFGINHEVFSFGEGLGAQLAPSQTSPDVMNYAWRDYGNRVGAWRFLELFDKLSLKTTALMNGALIDKCPELAKACRDRGDDIAAHGVTNTEAQGNMTASKERAMIARTLDHFEKLDVRPTGWLGPWISESHCTPDLLKEAGFRYLLDWAHDDQPTKLATKDDGHLLSIPYSQEINDIPAIIGRNQEADRFAMMIEDAVRQLLSECDRRPLVLGIALHPYVMGQSHRTRHLDRVLTKLREEDDPRIWWTTAGDIADFMETRD
ncbi:MAG: polysaccharide deacetylase family protein [Parvularcula sp.]|jgi:peptidoglycan/xylan/chitin deacetylase (PgdA/CDA1 family)|nr:polysaccharide deacetylase family protein [Parvularcula sp.]